MRTRTISQPSGIEVRPNLRPERTGPYMRGIVIDSRIGHIQRSRDVPQDTDGESNLQRIINKRAQQLKNDRQSLKDRLEHTYSCGLHNVGHLLHTLPTTCLMRDSNLSTRGYIRTECHHPNLWQKLASFFRGTYTSLYKI